MKLTDETVYLIFHAADGEFALPAESVTGMHWVPELAPARGMERGTVGIFQRFGRAVPVLDLSHRFGHPGGYHLTDIVIVVEVGDRQVGVLTQEIKRLGQGVPLRIGDAGVGEAERPRHLPGRQSLILAELDVDGDIAALLDPDVLVLEVFDTREAVGGEPFWPGATQAERDTLRRRAAALRHPLDTGLTGVENRLAVVRVGSELLVLELAQVSEFAEIGLMAPVPCSPAHIRGTTNLRGNIVTVVDLLTALGIGTTSIEKTTKLAVVRDDGLLAGFPINEIRQLTSLKPGRLKPKPPQASKYIRGELILDGGVATIVDLHRLLTADELIVDEQVGG